MSTGLLNTWIKNRDGNLLAAWMVDVAIQRIGGAGNWLVDFYPKIIENLKKRYSGPAIATDLADYGSLIDQGGQTVELVFSGFKTDTNTSSGTYGQGIPYSETRAAILTAPAATPEQIACQIRPAVDDLADVTVCNGHIRIVTHDRGYDVQITVGAGNTTGFGWCFQSGNGWRVLWRNYSGARRINIHPGMGNIVNHIEFDVPPGEYIMWSRCCHQDNEETAPAYVLVKCGDHLCVNLILPTVNICGKQDWFPMIDHVINDQGPIVDQAERKVILKGLKYVAGLEKAEIQANLQQRLQDAALAPNQAELETRINAVKAVAELLGECY